MVKSRSEFVETTRTRAREIKQRTLEAGSPVTLQQAYELLAKESGYRTWAAMKNSSQVSVREPSNEALPTGSNLVASTPRFHELMSQAQKELAEVVDKEPFNPLSVANAVAYDLAQSLDEETLRKLHRSERWLTRIDFDDEESHANFGKPKTEVDRMRFAVAVAVLDRIDFSAYAALLADYGWQPWAIKRLQGRVANPGEQGAVVLDGISHGMTTVRRR